MKCKKKNKENKIQISPANSIEEIVKKCMLHIFHHDQQLADYYYYILSGMAPEQDLKWEKKIENQLNTHTQTQLLT